jgi:hypothetical protein
MTGIRDARANGFDSTTHGNSATAMATSTGSTAIAGDGTTDPIKTTNGIKAVGDTGINIKTAGDSTTSTATSTGSPEIAGDGITGGFMVRRGASTTTARPATIETTMSSSNKNHGKTACARDLRLHVDLENVLGGTKANCNSWPRTFTGC